MIFWKARQITNIFIKNRKTESITRKVTKINAEQAKKYICIIRKYNATLSIKVDPISIKNTNMIFILLFHHLVALEGRIISYVHPEFPPLLLEGWISAVIAERLNIRRFLSKNQFSIKAPWRDKKRDETLRDGTARY